MEKNKIDKKQVKNNKTQVLSPKLMERTSIRWHVIEESEKYREFINGLEKQGRSVSEEIRKIILNEIDWRKNKDYRQQLSQMMFYGFRKAGASSTYSIYNRIQDLAESQETEMTVLNKKLDFIINILTGNVDNNKLSLNNLMIESEVLKQPLVFHHMRLVMKEENIKSKKHRKKQLKEIDNNNENYLQNFSDETYDTIFSSDIKIKK